MNPRIARVASQRARPRHRGLRGRGLDEQPSAGSKVPSLRSLSGAKRIVCTLLTGLVGHAGSSVTLSRFTSLIDKARERGTSPC